MGTFGCIIGTLDLVVAGVEGEALVLLGGVLSLSSLRHLVTTEAVNLHTGKSPGLRLQLALVAISEDSTSCLLAFTVDLNIIFALLRSN